MEGRIKEIEFTEKKLLYLTIVDFRPLLRGLNMKLFAGIGVNHFGGKAAFEEGSTCDRQIALSYVSHVNAETIYRRKLKHQLIYVGSIW